MPDQTLDPLLDVTTASGLLPAGTALSTFADNKRSRFGKSDIWFGDKALGLKTTVAHVIHYCQLPKELENRVNDFNNLHNAVFEFLVLRQGRASAWPVGKMVVKRAAG